MPEVQDPFSGRWRFNARRSRLSTPLPQVWVQSIGASHDQIVVTENIIRDDGSQSEVKIWAKFDGTDYPITGLPIADVMAYQRHDSYSFSGTGKKNGVVVLTQTVTVDSSGQTLTLIYSFQSGASQVARGMAVFDRDW